MSTFLWILVGAVYLVLLVSVVLATLRNAVMGSTPHVRALGSP